MHLVRVGRSPAYLSDMMTPVADLLGRERPAVIPTYCMQQAATTATICGPDSTNQRAALVGPQIRTAPHFAGTRLSSILAPECQNIKK